MMLPSHRIALPRVDPEFELQIKFKLGLFQPKVAAYLKYLVPSEQAHGRLPLKE